MTKVLFISIILGLVITLASFLVSRELFGEPPGCQGMSCELANNSGGGFPLIYFHTFWENGIDLEAFITDMIFWTVIVFGTTGLFVIVKKQIKK